VIGGRSPVALGSLAMSAAPSLDAGCDARLAHYREMAPTARGSQGQMSAHQLIVVYIAEITSAVLDSIKL
jgi:hypothetical protein